MLHLIVGVLKVNRMKQEAVEDSVQDLKQIMQDCEGTSSIVEMEKKPEPVTRNISMVRVDLDKPPTSKPTTGVSFTFKLRKHQHCRSLGPAKWTSLRSDGSTGRERPSTSSKKPPRSNEEIMAATQFTSSELNRIITSVGGGYLLKKSETGKSQQTKSHRSNLDIHNNKISYLGFDRLINRTKQHRENRKVSNLLS